MWRAAGGRFRPAHVTRDEWAGSSELRHAASVQSRTIMKNPPSAEAAADTHDSHRRHRASHPRLPEQHLADRWLEDPDQLFLSLNAEENGTARFALFSYCMRGECGKNWGWARFCGVSALAAALRDGMRVARCFLRPCPCWQVRSVQSRSSTDCECVALRWARPGNSRGFGSCISRC